MVSDGSAEPRYLNDLGGTKSRPPALAGGLLFGRGRDRGKRTKNLNLATLYVGGICARSRSQGR